MMPVKNIDGLILWRIVSYNEIRKNGKIADAMHS